MMSLMQLSNSHILIQRQLDIITDLLMTKLPIADPFRQQTCGTT